MINNFYSWIDSKYDNIEQSQMYPTFYSNITITNCVLDTGFIYGEQTNKSKNIVYRQYLTNLFSKTIKLFYKAIILRENYI